MKDLVIYGTSKFSEIVFSYLSTASDFNVRAFTVDREYMSDREFCGLPVITLDDVSERYPPGEFDMIVATGYNKLNKIRQEMYHRAKERGYSLASYVHPSSTVADSCTIGDNCIILENNVLQPFCEIQENVVIWSSNVIGHHSIVSRHSFITSLVGVSGHSIVGERCFLGFGSGMAPEIAVGEDCVLGAHSLLLEDAAPGGVYRQISTPRSKAPSHRVAML